MAMRIGAVIATDLARTLERPMPTSTIGRLTLLGLALPTIKGLAIIGFRLSHHVGRKSKLGGAVVKQITHALTGADIGFGASIGPGLRILHPTGIVITDKASIGSRCTVHSCTIGSSTDGSPVIGDDVSIAPGARVLGDVRVDDGCHVAANAVLTRSIPGTWKVLAGVPARAIREREAPLLSSI
jgi:serine O-acetyltransferase